MTTKTKKHLKRFEAFSNGEMDSDAKRDFNQSLKSDAEVREAWYEYRGMLEALNDTEAITLRLLLEKEFKNHQSIPNILIINSPWTKWSAAAIILIIMGSMIYFFCSSQEPERYANDIISPEADSSIYNDKLQESDSLNIASDIVSNQIKAPEADQIALLFEREEYQISPIYSELLNNVYRNAWFRLKAPEDSVFIENGGAIIFTWETSIKDSFYFDVLDRNGKVIYQQKVPVESPLSYKASLPPAIYMYRFSTKEQPVWMGVLGVR